MNSDSWSEKRLKLLVLLTTIIIAWHFLKGTNMQAQGTPSTNPGVQEVVKLSKAKMSDDVIMSYIKNSGTSYNLSADDVLYLNSQGVSQPIISTMLQAKGNSAPAPAPAPVTQPTTPAPPTSPAPVAQPTAPAPVVSDATPPPPLAGSDVTLPYFQTQLAPYGTWVDVSGYGLCWRPSVALDSPDWRPYCDAGHWEYTDDGWYWRSDYPWGEYAFHYGRWFRDARFGWVWVPGYHWGPGWVCWRNSDDGYFGWAPLPPGARFELGVGLTWHGHLAVDADFGLGPDMFVFVGYDHFWEHDYRPFAAPPWRRDGLFRHSVIENHYRFAGGHFIVEGIGRDRVGLLTHHDVAIGRIEFHDEHIAHERDLQHTRGFEIERGRDGHDFRDGRDHRGF